MKDTYEISENDLKDLIMSSGVIVISENNRFYGIYHNFDKVNVKSEELSNGKIKISLARRDFLHMKKLYFCESCIKKAMEMNPHIYYNPHNMLLEEGKYCIRCETGNLNCYGVYTNDIY